MSEQGLGASDMPVLWKIISGIFGDLKREVGFRL
jgi:hypothetical protein